MSNHTFERVGFEQREINGKKLVVYHQGGLDSYCGLYSIFNFINFVKFYQSEGRESDFLRQRGFAPFREIIREPQLQSLFSRDVFGGSGVEGEDLIPVFRQALKTADISAKLFLAEDLSFALGDPVQGRSFARKGIEEAFRAPEKVLGLAVVQEGERDTLGQWVVLVGPGYINGEWLVLDSNRDYKSCHFDGRNFRVQRHEENENPQNWSWIYSFISVVI